MNAKQKLDGAIRLTRHREYFFFVIVTTLLGAAAANGYLSWRLAGVLVANWLAVGFAFMINDVEDAPDDALTPAKRQRNPVSAQDLSHQEGWTLSLSVALLSALAYALLGFWPFVAGCCCLIIGFLYSWRPIRLKAIPGLDLLSHGLMLAGLQYLCAFFTFEPAHYSRWIFPFLFVVGVSLYGELFNEMRDLEGDLQAGVRHTAGVLGPRLTTYLMMTILSMGVLSGLVTIVWVKLIPGWVVILLLTLAVLFNIPALIKVRRQQSSIDLQQSFHKPLEMAAAAALVLQFISGWAISLLK